MVDVVAGFNAFPARPPTPPRESSSKLLRDTAFLNGSTIHPLLDTPEESPASSAEYFRDSSGKARKKVGFSGWTQYHQPGPIGEGGFGSSGNRKKLPPSRECNPTKPILKRYSDVSTSNSKENLPFDTGDLPAMLRSAALHLAGNLRSSKIDAYNSLLGCLNAYDDVPNSQELAEKMVEISGFIKRDINTKNTDGTTDTQLAAQALKVMTVLLYTKGTTNLIPEEFCSFIFEQSIKCMEDPTSPKILISHHMHLLEKQKFSQKILVSERLNRLLSVLTTITARVKGNRVVCQRLNIYHRLLSQAKSLMISRTTSWIDHMISGLLSSLKDVRARAIAFGMEAGLQVGTAASVSQDCMNAFNRQSPEGTKVVEFVESRLKEMTKNKEDGLHVPQIWSVVLLLLRGRSQQIERWEHLKLWLGILQQCFNSSDAQIKFQANIAWNRFIFAVDLSMSTSVSLARMLKQPIVSQLERKSTDKSAKQAKQIARSSYCTLLNYALRPTASYAQLDHYWDLYVVDLLPRAFSSSQADIEYACDILTNLFFNNSQQPKVWDVNKANATGPMKPGDLVPLDSKWIRSQTESIVTIFQKLLEVADRGREIEDSPLIPLWQNLMSALGNAGSKEVKVSLGTMTAMAKILDCLKGLLVSRRSVTTGFDDLKMFNMLLKDAVAKLGYIPFNEKRLLLTQSNHYEALAETPSARGSSKTIALDSAAAHLLELLLETKDGQSPASRETAFETVVHVMLHNASSRWTRLQTLRNLARHVSIAGSASSSLEASLELWTSLAKEAIASLESSKTSDLHNNSPEYPGQEYRDVVKILELGIRLHSNTAYEIWNQLLETLCRTLEKDVGKAAIVQMVHEPLAEVIRKEVLSRYDEVIVWYAVSLLKNFQWPGTLRAIEHAQVQLWGVMPVRHKTELVEFLDPCQKLIGALLESSYSLISSTSEAVATSAISAVMLTIKSLPEEYRRQLIANVQEAIGLFIKDDRNAIPRQSNVFTEVQQLYGTVRASLESASLFDNAFLTQYHNLFISCLGSRHRPVLNHSIAFWNRTIGTADRIDYPQDLMKMLLKLKGATNIRLPGFPESGHEDDAPSPLNVFDSSESDEEAPDQRRQDLTPIKGSLFGQRSPRFSTPSRLFSISPAAPFSASKELNLPQSKRRDVKTTPKAKLRHENSQLQFAAIESSPLVEDPEESQRLTDRQKEVKERQRYEASLFPEIRSSPRTSNLAATHRLPAFALNSGDHAQKLQEDEALSPSFPPDTMMNDYLGSSPTPSSSKKRSEEPYSDEGPPSSPPLMGSHLEIGQTSSPSDHIPQVHGDEQNRESFDGVAERTEEALSMSLQSKPINGNQGTSTMVNPIQQDAEIDTHVTTADNGILSDMDVFVDAPTDNFIASEEGLNITKNSTISPQASRVSKENDEVTAQLMGEIAEASSQTSRLPQLQRNADGGEGLKRRMAKPADGPRKRQKGDSLQEKHRSEESSSGEVVADCVLITSRPRSSGTDTVSPVIKREPSASSQPQNSVTDLSDQVGEVGERHKEVNQVPGEGKKPDGETIPAKRGVRIKGEQGVNRSGRITRTSSRLSDAATSSPIRSEASFASQEQAGAENAVWVMGPRGSRWAYIPQTVPVPSAADPSALPLSPADVEHDVHESTTSRPPTVDVGNAQFCEQEAEADDGSAEAPTPGGILDGLRSMLEDVKKVRLRPEEERAMVAVLFESVQEVHEAGRRHQTL